ncbi:similar to Saccharomyces cerevisiae YAL027W SAW1 Protein involved in Rad1p/Rad10p-dependent removal of 3'-nonhomologous tails during double-strand break repair via single-strand annealing [Maudiozyma barnettii]|uniref:Similar to Saccharomyces cerevisiae YAL027W SAW1 Protein involved in Rad1p/Rad10p-dependent removal of 3'-nonhomologous tails during double-strand break repair via single-strand annealing n=1 Tax=Maudiozyma barnettii TaxID=61262 RepID=A0A8H2VGN8_9SACH|nr:similar to Saccharomyces cerevisiae YAL027W SAW1 Protein involved in Rad1p/Rad10p-dependent removal of 3'-nonhomologous tails during double-strand break repair via single-strand annealing [Kazachstania barnettii]CAB4255319.1 similar to Saccharomyces cerevisiae YAL027W SAW1 Protein involved in Rad1p/Rad10p-dependent removal of 3'-nonhomologous tails during double-strand break repair via single-strand annealing [Kazachstania barnettii]CAD1783725.1 similar to Saccharomyces cerevisiae YAL027W SAW1
MVVSLATLKISDNIAIQLRIFVNRKQILQNNDKVTTLFEAPLLSNNSIVSLKSLNTGIYLSNTDMNSLCDEIKEEIRLILYDLVSPNISKTVLQKIRIGQKIDFQTKVLQPIRDSLDPTSDSFIKSGILSISRVSRFKYMLHYESKWKLDIFVENIAKLASIRQLLIFKYSLAMNVPHKRRMLIMERFSSPPNRAIVADNSDDDVDLGIEESTEDVKPEIKFRYKPVRNLGPILDIHILERPRRHN